MTQLAALNIKISGDSADFQSDIAKAREQLRDFENKVKASGKQTNGFSGALGKLGNVSGSTRAKIQNTSFQLQDIAVQLQGGTRASTVFAQQLPQLLGGFGALGAVAGVLAGVGIPALAFAFSAMGNEAKDSEEALDNFTASMKSATDFMRIAQTPIKDLREEFGEFADEIQRASIVASQAALSEALIGFGNAASGIRESLGDAVFFVDKYNLAVQRLSEAQEKFGDSFSNKQLEIFQKLIDSTADQAAEAANAIGLTSDQAVKLAAALKDLSDADSMEEIATASAKALDLIGRMFGTSQKMPPEVAKIVLELENVVTAAAAGAAASSNLKTELEGGRDAARELADEMAFIASLSPEVQARMVVAGVESGAIPPQALGDLPQTTADKEMQKILERRRKLARTPVAGPGRAVTNPLIGDLDAIEQSLMTAEELQIASYERQQETLKSALDQKLIAESEYARLSEQIAQAHAGAMIDAANNQTRGTLNNLQTMFQGSKKIGAGLALANSYLAFTEVLKDPSFVGRPFARIAAAGAALSSGLQAVSSIRSASIGGGGGSGVPSSGNIASSANGGASVSRNVSIQLTGGDMFGRDQVIGLINQINEAVEDGAIVRLV